MPGTYEPIATTTLNNNYQGIFFNNIPQTYTDLVMVFKGHLTQDFWDLGMRFNNSSSGYSNIGWATENTIVGAAKNSSFSIINIGYSSGWRTDNLYNIGYVHIYQYANTNMNKVVSITHTNPQYTNGSSLATWASTTAISSIYLYSRGSNSNLFDIVAGSQVTLYGIKAA